MNGLKKDDIEVLVNCIVGAGILEEPIDASTYDEDAKETDASNTCKNHSHIKVAEIVNIENLKIPWNLRVIPVEQNSMKRKNSQHYVDYIKVMCGSYNFIVLIFAKILSQKFRSCYQIE